jgi:hypothetical protein
MRMSPNLPIEEQERLQREYEMKLRDDFPHPAIAMPYKPLGSRTGLDSMFNDLGQPNISNHMYTPRQQYEQARREAAKYRKESGDMGRYVMDSPTRTERSFEDWMKSRKDRPTLWRNPNPFGPNIDDTYPTAEEVRPEPGITMFQPLSTQPIINIPGPVQEPPGGGLHDWGPKNIPGPVQEPPGGMPRPGRGRGFLNRFERLLDGLEGLVGKLGGESPKDTGPLVDPVGGVGSLTPTPFTASQDY